MGAVQESSSYSELEAHDRHAQRILSDRDRDIFLALLAEDDQPNDALQQAARRYEQLQPSIGW
jgi:uncharacterized protein (DUF1778 family)